MTPVQHFLDCFKRHLHLPRRRVVVKCVYINRMALRLCGAAFAFLSRNAKL